MLLDRSGRLCRELWKGREQGGLFGWTGNHPEKGFSQIWLQLIQQSVEAVFFFFFFPIFSCCSKSGDQPQKDLAKSGYKTNRQIENLGILLHVGETLERVSYIWRFQKENTKNLPKISKNVRISLFLNPPNLAIFLEFKKNIKMPNFRHR